MAYVERERRELVFLNYVEPVRSPLAARRLATALGHVGYFAELSTSGRRTPIRTRRCFGSARRWWRRWPPACRSTPLARYFEYWLLRLQGVYQPRSAVVARGAGVPGGGADVQSVRRCATSPVSQPGAAGARASHRALIAQHLEKDLKSVRVLREMGRST